MQRLAIGYIRVKFKLLAAVSKRWAAREAFDLFCTPQRRHRKELIAPFTQAELLQFDFEGYHIVGYRWNKGGSRKALIVHGFESTSINFGAYVEPLTRKGYEVLAFDAPAHGNSSGDRINALIYSDFVKYIHRHFGPVQSFMAHSLGGLALGIALSEIPHDAGFRVVLVAPATKTATALDHFFGFIHLRDAGVRREFERIIVEVGGHPADWFSLTRALDRVSAHILWIHDVDDTITPLRDAEEVKNKNYPNVQFLFTKGLGHRRIYRDAEVGKTIVNYM